MKFRMKDVHLCLTDFSDRVLSIRARVLRIQRGLQRPRKVPALDCGPDEFVRLLHGGEDLGGRARVRVVQRLGVEAVLVVLVDVDPPEIYRCHACVRLRE